jgi:hypothetical protein
VPYPHRIRLRGPWEYEPLAFKPDRPGEALPPDGRMTLPCLWAAGGLPGFAGRVLFRRRFGYPGRIDAVERVWLTFGGLEGTAQIQLNGQELPPPKGPGRPFEYEVTGLLQARNELVVEIEGAETGGLWGEVALEVRRTAFLCNVQVEAVHCGEKIRLQARGGVAGTSEQPLELYVILDRFNVAYATVEAGHPFILESEELAPAQIAGLGQPVRVELVGGAVAWYTLDTVVEPQSP